MLFVIREESMSIHVSPCPIVTKEESEEVCANPRPILLGEVLDSGKCSRKILASVNPGTDAQGEPTLSLRSRRLSARLRAAFPRRSPLAPGVDQRMHY